jgi:TRAP-type C4-dicarboxylate transport system substrate-binding protein
MLDGCIEPPGIDVKRDGEGRTFGEAGDRSREAAGGKHAWLEAERESGEAFARLADPPTYFHDRIRELTVGRIDGRDRLVELEEMSLGALPEAAGEKRALSAAREHKPPAGCAELVELVERVGLQEGVLPREAERTREGARQGVVHVYRHVVGHHDEALGTERGEAPVRQHSDRQRPPVLVDVGLATDERELQRAVAEHPAKRVTDRARLTQLDHVLGNGRGRRTTRERENEEHPCREQPCLVTRQQRALANGPVEKADRGDASDRERKGEGGGRRPTTPDPQTHDQQREREHDDGRLVVGKRGPEQRHRDRSDAQSRDVRVDSPQRKGKNGGGEYPPMDVGAVLRRPRQDGHVRRSEVPGEPREARAAEEGAAPTVRSDAPPDEPARHEPPTDREVGDPRSGGREVEGDELGRDSESCRADGPREGQASLMGARHAAIVTSRRTLENGGYPQGECGAESDVPREVGADDRGHPIERRATMTTRTLLAAAISVAAVGSLATGIASAAEPPDKSGGKKPVVLTLLNSDDDDLTGVPAVQQFIDRVHQLSGGSLTIEVLPQHDGHAGFERRVVRDVTADRAQLAWVGTRVWDTLGVNTFRALSAPLLIDSYALEGAVLRSNIPARMLAGLDGHGVVGLALLGDNLRYPAAKRELRRPADFKGLRIRSLTSATQAAAFRALGARPSGEGWAELGAALASGRLGGLEVDLNTYESNAYAGVAPYVTVNAALWPRTTVLFANEVALAKLSQEQQGWIREAAADAARYSLTTFGEDKRIVQLECRNGMKAVTASAADLSALRRAFAPVYASLRHDSPTAAMLAQITALKRNVHASPLTVPSTCRAVAVSPTAGEAVFPEGVYRARRTREDIERVWPNASAKDIRANVATATYTFKRGAFDLRLTVGGLPGCRQGDGRYTVSGQIMTVIVTDVHGCPGVKVPLRAKLRWSYEGGTLRFRLAQSAYPLDHVVWEAVALTRIG